MLLSHYAPRAYADFRPLFAIPNSFSIHVIGVPDSSSYLLEQIANAFGVKDYDGFLTEDDAWDMIVYGDVVNLICGCNEPTKKKRRKKSHATQNRTVS